MRLKKPATSVPNKSHRRKKKEAQYQKLLQGQLDNLVEERQKIEPILLKYAHIFHDEETNDFPGKNVRTSYTCM